MRHRVRLVAAALAAALALAGCGRQAAGDAASADDAGAAPARPGTAIPDDFPLSAGMGGPEDSVPTSRTGTGLRDLELCAASPLRGVGTRDRLVADNSGGEAADTRELVLLGAPEDASRLVGEIVGLVEDCDEPRAGRADAAGVAGVETRTEVLASPFGPRPAATLLQTHTVDGEPGTGATVVHVVPVGAAVLLASTYGQWTSERAQEAVDATVDPLRETVAALCVFTRTGC
jgi:hypothetical protein